MKTPVTSKKNVYPNMAPVVNQYIEALRENFSAKRFYIVQEKMNGNWTILHIRRGNWFSGFWGQNHNVKLYVCANGNDMETEIKTLYLRLHFTLWLFIVMLLIPYTLAFFIASLHFLFLFWILFFFFHLLGFIRQGVFARKIRKYTELYSKNNQSVRRFCPNCGKLLEQETQKCLCCGD